MEHYNENNEHTIIPVANEHLQKQFWKCGFFFFSVSKTTVTILNKKIKFFKDYRHESCDISSQNLKHTFS